MNAIPNITIEFTDPYSLGFLTYFASIALLAIIFYFQPRGSQEKRAFWTVGGLLILFSATRPIGLSRDDLAYVEIVKGISPIFECLGCPIISQSRDWGWYFLVGLLKLFLSNERALLAISAMYVCIQLYIISKLCRHKLLALTLFIPLTYVYFDLTLLRAGAALTLLFVGLYYLVASQKFLGFLSLGGGYLFHSQGVFSIGVIPFSLIAKYKYISMVIIVALVVSIYLELVPTSNFLNLLYKTEIRPYLDQHQNGIFTGEHVFPIGQLLIIAYCIFILITSKRSPEFDLLQRYTLASILLAVFLAWFFAPIHAAQTRFFDFYIAPLIFMVGNIKLNKTNLILTLGLAALLYARLELIHNWILG